MAAIVKVIKNADLEACIKIKSEGGGDVIITKEMLCYKPDPYTSTIDQENKNTKFQDVTPKSIINILNMQWAGYDQAAHGKLYRGGEDLEHTIVSFCVGDTTALEFEGQLMGADSEYCKEDLHFKLTGDMTIWLRIRKRDYATYAGEYATYGQYEDDSKLGPKTDK